MLNKNKFIPLCVIKSKPKGLREGHPFISATGGTNKMM